MRTEIALFVSLTGGLALATSPPLNAQPQPAGQLLELHAFRSELPITFQTIQGSIDVSEGFAAVLEVDRQRLIPVDGPAPVLFVGDTAARVVNLGYRSGRTVVLIPRVELSTTPIYFGPARAMRFITAEMLTATRPVGSFAASLPPLQDEWRVADMNELYRRAAELVLRHAPQERSIAEMYLGVTRR